MCSSIAQQIENSVENSGSTSSLSQLLITKNKTSFVDASAIEAEAQHLVNDEIDSLSSHLQFVRKLAVIAYVSEDLSTDSLKRCWKLHNESLYISVPIIQMYDAIIRIFAKKNPSIIPNEDYAENFSSRFFHYLEDHFFLAFEELLLLNACGKLLNNSHMLNKACELASYFSLYFDEKAFTLLSAFAPEREYSETDDTYLVYLFSRAFFSNSVVLQELEARLNSFTTSNFHPFFLLLDKLIQTVSVDSENSHSCYHNFYSSDDTLLVKTQFGKNTPMGAFRKKTIEIAAFGPQYLPLDQSSQFGIFHLPSNIATAGSFWTRTSYFHENYTEIGPDWLKVDISAGESIRFSIHSKKFSDDPLFFSFFVKAHEVTIEGQKSLAPATIDNFKGSCSEIRIRDSVSSISFKTNDMQNVEVFPLAGENFFWSSDFLIAYQIKDINKNFICEIF